MTAVTQPANGTVTLLGGVVSFTPAANFNGGTSFTYTISDGALSDTATVSVTVTSVNDIPEAADDTHDVAEDSGPATVNVLGNDTGAEAGETLAVTASRSPPTAPPR